MYFVDMQAHSSARWHGLCILIGYPTYTQAIYAGALEMQRALEMPGTELRPGDAVVYRDGDRILWGPWEVIRVLEGRATVEVEKRVTYSVDASLLQKVEVPQGPN